MLEICADADAALLLLAERRGLLSPAQLEQVRRTRGRRSAAVALVQDGVLDVQAVRALRTAVRKRSIDHAIDGYELQGRLGSGGMSEVFKAIDLVSRKPVAIKVVSPRRPGDGLFLERFHREARAASAVDHPNVIACYGTGQTHGKAYMVLEYMPGGDLEGLVGRAQGRLEEAHALRIAMDCVRGLVAVHAHGLVHRDVKPSNILLAADGSAKLGDLGLAKSASPDDQLTMPGMRVGSPGYVSPEQASGAGETDIRSDIFSLGATFHHLFSGRSPFTGGSPLEIIINTIRQDAPPLSLTAPWVSPRISALVGKCLARRPEDRFQDPGELAEALHGIRKGAPATAPVRRPRRSVASRVTAWRLVVRRLLAGIGLRRAG